MLWMWCILALALPVGRSVRLHSASIRDGGVALSITERIRWDGQDSDDFGVRKTPLAPIAKQVLSEYDTDANAYMLDDRPDEPVGQLQENLDQLRASRGRGTSKSRTVAVQDDEPRKSTLKEATQNARHAATRTRHGHDDKDEAAGSAKKAATRTAKDEATRTRRDEVVDDKRAADVLAERNVHVLGLQNSGTNLLQAVLSLSFGPRLLYFDGEVGRNETDGNWRHGVWKHADIKFLTEVNGQEMKSLMDQSVVGLMMIRDPLAWLQSVRKAPFELKHCVEQREWLTSTCQHPFPAGREFHQSSRRYPSLEAIWSRWNRAYQDFGNHGFTFGLIIRYEDLVEQPEAEMERVARFLGIESLPKHWSLKYGSGYTTGSRGRDEALDAMHNKTYLKAYTDGELKSVCKLLDSDLMKAYGYWDDCKKQ